MLKIFKNTGFTLIEIMITIVLIGIIAAFAIPNYEKSIAKAHERDAINGLKMIYTAGQLYKAHKGSYGMSNHNLLSINNMFNINLIANDIEYDFQGYDSSFIATAKWGTAFTIEISSDNPLETTNPCCFAGTCPSLNNC